MGKNNTVIISSVIISLLFIASVLLAHHEGYLFKVLWSGDCPYDEYYCYPYDIYPEHGQGMAGNLPPEYLGFYVDTNAPPDHVFAKVQWCDDDGWHRSSRIWFAQWNNYDAEVTRIDDDTYYIKYFISDYTSASKFVNSSYYWWKVEVYYCENPTAGTGRIMWHQYNYWFFYTDNRPPRRDYPIADAGGPYIVTVGEKLQLDGSGSTDPNNNVIMEYIWDIYNDGTWDVTGVNPKVKFNTAGIYEIKLRVVNTHAYWDEDVTTVTVTNINNPPVANANGPYAGLIGENIQLDGSGSYDPDENPLSYEWDVDGDGTYDLTGRIVNVTYLKVGTFNVVLKVSDGQYSDTDTTVVTISSPPPPPSTNEPPVAEAGGPYECYADKWVVLDASGSYDPDGYIVDYKWDIDNDGVWDLHGEQVNVTFNNVGIFVVKLNVTDDYGATAEDTTVVTVHENPTPPPPPPEETEKSVNYWWFGIFALLLLIPIGLIALRDKNERKKY